MNDNDRYWRDASDDMAEAVWRSDRFADEARFAYAEELRKELAQQAMEDCNGVSE
jgi:hypothetical protein